MPAEIRFSAPKVLGADFEVGNFIHGRDGRYGTGDVACRKLLAEVPGVMAVRTPQYGLWTAGYGGGWSYAGASSGSAGFDPQDRDRRFLPENGGSAYCDLEHAEFCLPEVTSARDFVAAYHGMLRIVARARERAQAQLEDGETLEVLINNSDGLSNSYGSHINFLVTRQLWEELMSRRAHYLGFLASHQTTSIVYTGQGKVGSENDRAPVDYQLAQRADFFETLCALQTTHRRPIVNSRDESLCGSRDDDYARLHHIFSDAGLCHVATYLKVGTMSLVLAMLEAGELDLGVLIDDPVDAVVTISHDPTLTQPVRLAGGGGATALEIQRRIWQRAAHFADRTGFPTVPGADAILTCWEDTLDRLATGELAAVSDRLDWAAKLEWLELARSDSGLEWGDPELKHLDLLYASVDPERGLYWASERAGTVVRLVDDAEIERFTHEPPEDTRAWTRAMLLRRFGPADAVERVDWHRMVIDMPSNDGASRRVELALADPLGHTRAENGHLFERHADPSERPAPPAASRH